MPDDPVVRPGTPSFRCIADDCEAMCCHNPYRVDLGEDELAQLAQRVDVWEVVEERAAMILMRQDDGACALLSGNLRCSEYEVRPKGCRDYPFRLVVEEGSPPRVERDLACPGFIGPPMTVPEYEGLVASLSRTGSG